MKSGLFLPWSVLVGLFFFTSNAEAARATTLILGKSKPEPKIDIPPTAEEENVSISVPANSNLSNETINVGNVTKLTGVPQIDYIYDPNLPRELNGYNLTDYPFYNSVPEDIDFKCDGLHDGFYASVPHKCQVYHHCLFGTRYDFLCANYTAFDQKTFICHFASEVDCKNSPRYFNRNEALYKATTTTTLSPFGFSGSAGRRPQPDSPGGRRRRPYRRRKPSYEYYDEYEDLAEDDYYDEASNRRRKRPRPASGRDSYDDAEEEGSEGEKPLPPSGPNKSVFDRPRIAPKIRRPVPVNERDKYDYSSDSRAIVKEPVVEKKRFEDAESSSRKQTNNKAPDYYDSIGNGNPKHKEPDTEREREREHKGDEYESERERERDRERERERDRERERERERERDERPYRRPPKKRRRPDGLDDEYDEYDDVRRYRNRNRPRYEEYEDYEYEERPYRRNRDQDYRNRDHEYDRDRPYRNRESDYDRPGRNRDRIREDERPVRNRDIDDRPVRNRDDERPLRPRDEERPIRVRDSDKPKDQDDRSNRNRNEQQYRNDGKATKTRIRDDDRQYYNDEDRYRDRGVDENKRNKEVYREETVGGKKEEDIDRPYKYKDPEDNYNRQTPQDEADKYRNRNQEKPPRYRDNLDKFGKSRVPSREEVDESKGRVPEGSYNGRLRPIEQTERPVRGNDRGVPRPGNGQKPRLPLSSSEEDVRNSEEQSKPVPATRPSYITKPEPPPRKQFNLDPPGRKTNGFKRPALSRAPSVTDFAEGQDKYRPGPSFPVEDLPSPTTDRYEDKPFERPKYASADEEQQSKFIPSDDLRGTIEQLNEKLLPLRPEDQPQVGLSQSGPPQPKLRVPHEDSVPKEELAPRAPKFPQTSPRRRPFLPSRNGNPNLPRNLLPVGVKALQTPRGFQAPTKKLDEDEPKTTNPQEKERQQTKYQLPSSPGGIEFRAKVSTAIGVDQPKLTQFFQDVQSSSELELPEYGNPQGPGPSAVEADYYSSGPQNEEGKPAPEARPFPNAQPPPPPRQFNNQPNTQDLSSSHNIPEYNDQPSRQESNSNINFRPTLKPTDFPQLSVPDAPPSQHAHPQENRNLEQALKNRPLPSAINQQFNQQFNQQYTTKPPLIYPPPPPTQPPSPPQTQLGPQSFYSENPKFHTTVKVPEPFPYKPTPPNSNFNSATHLPVFQGSVRQTLPNAKQEPLRYDNGQRPNGSPQESFKPLNLKFPSQNENLDTDEYDVSLNDALQPISTLHPRNVPTGVFLNNWQRNQQQPAGFKRRVFQVAPAARQQNEPQEFTQRKQELPPRVSLESRNVPAQQKTHKLGSQRQAPSKVYQRYVQPPPYNDGRPVTNTGNYFAIYTQ